MIITKANLSRPSSLEIDTVDRIRAIFLVSAIEQEILPAFPTTHFLR